MRADITTPIKLYMQLRDHFTKTLLLECADSTQKKFPLFVYNL